MLDRSRTILALVTSVLGAACSSSSSGVPDDPGDGGSGGGASAVSYCSAEGARFDRCLTLQPAACTKALKESCPTRDAFHSDTYKKAFAQCAPGEACDDSVATSACVAPLLKAAPPTAVQAKLADDLCAACANGGRSSREEGLSCEGHVVTGEGRRLGQTILSLSDSAAARVGATCIAPAKQSFPNDYMNCENQFLNCVGEQLVVPTSCNE